MQKISYWEIIVIVDSGKPSIVRVIFQYSWTNYRSILPNTEHYQNDKTLPYFTFHVTNFKTIILARSSIKADSIPEISSLGAESNLFRFAVAVSLAHAAQWSSIGAFFYALNNIYNNIYYRWNFQFWRFNWIFRISLIVWILIIGFLSERWKAQ